MIFTDLYHYLDNITTKMNVHNLELLNSRAVREEIQRFESVHPHIYAIYDLLEQIDDPNLQDQLREHVVCIEGMQRDKKVVFYHKCLLLILCLFIFCQSVLYQIWRYCVDTVWD